MKTTFLQFSIDSDTRQLLRDGSEIHLSTKAFDLLCALIARRPSVVGKEELLQQVWPNSYVAEANLNVLIGEVRRALGETAETSQLIRTVHGVGYAFCVGASDIPNPTKPMSRSCMLIGDNRTFVLSEGENIIGRDPACSVWLDNPDISRRHARIRIDSAKGNALLDDLNSTNGTSLRRVPVKTATHLADGDVIQIGPIELKFRDAPDNLPQTRKIRRKSPR
jgi:DNA-binding winged helix-turn-helix (wHTH) protein